MNILFVTPSIPSPVGRGYQIISFHRLRILAAKHKITLACLYDHESDLIQMDALREYVTEIHPIRLSMVRRGLNILWGIFSSRPLQVSLCSDRHAAASIQQLIASGKFELINLYMLRLCDLISSSPVPVVIDLIDSLTLNFHRRIAAARFPYSLLLREEVRRLRHYEAAIARRFPTAVVSEVDRDMIGCDSAVIPLGVDSSEFYPAEQRCDNLIVIFTGNLFYRPNYEAVLWFIDQCWPAVRTANPGAVFRVVGADPPSAVMACHGRSGIEIVGRVLSMGDAMREASIAIAPMQSGSGMQFKILEAMACGLPVVATSLGRGAIQASRGEEILVADTPTEFSQAITALVENGLLAERIRKGGASLVKARYTWEAHCSSVERLYETVMQAKFRS